MKDARKVLALIIASAMLFGMVACSSSKDDKKSDKKSKVEDEDDEDEEEEETEDTEKTEETEETEETETTETTETSEETEELEANNGPKRPSGELVELDISNIDNKDLDKLIELTGCKVYTIDSFIANMHDESSRDDGMIYYAEGEDSCPAEEILEISSITGDSSDLLESWKIDESISSVCFVQNTGEDISEQIIVFEYADTATANEVFNSLIEDYAAIGVDVDALETQEYGNDGETAYMVINIDTENYVRMFVGEDVTQEEIDQYMDQIREMLGEISMVAALYQKDSRVYQVFYVAMGSAITAKTLPFITDDGFADPFTVDNSSAVMEALSVL